MAGWMARIQGRHHKLSPRYGGRNRRFKVLQAKRTVQVPIIRTSVKVLIWSLLLPPSLRVE